MTPWVVIDSNLLREARLARGLSHEAVGRRLNIAAKTWGRYEERGRVPRWMLPEVAELLGLQVDELPVPRVEVPGQDPDPLEELSEKMTRLLVNIDEGFLVLAGHLERIAQLLEPLDAGTQPRQKEAT